jgi:hypothetical protein
VRRRVRLGGLAALAVGLGIATVPAVGYSARDSKKIIPDAVSAISINATATYPRNVSFARTITNGKAVSELVALIDNMQRGPQYPGCPVELIGELKLALRFQGARKTQPVAVATAPLGGCAQVSLSTAGQKTLLLGRGNSAHGVIELIEKLVGVAL